MFRMLQFLSNHGYLAHISDGVVLVDRNSICQNHKDLAESDCYDYLEMILQDAFPKNQVRVVYKDDSWIHVQIR